jgi:hypothetical protein
MKCAALNIDDPIGVPKNFEQIELPGGNCGEDRQTDYRSQDSCQSLFEKHVCLQAIVKEFQISNSVAEPEIHLTQRPGGRDSQLSYSSLRRSRVVMQQGATMSAASGMPG